MLPGSFSKGQAKNALPNPHGVLNTSLSGILVARSHGEQVFDGQAAPTFIEMGRSFSGK